MPGTRSHSCRTTFTSTWAREGDGEPTALWIPSYLPPGTILPLLNPGATPPPALTERDSAATVSTIRGPCECRCSSSWVFSAAWGRGQEGWH